MAVESLVWAGLTTDPVDKQLADFTGQTWTADAGTGAGTGSLVVTATLLDGTDVFAAQTTTGINGTNDATQTNTGELVTGGNYTGVGGLSNSSLVLRNFEGDGLSGAGLTHTVSLQLDFTTNDSINNSAGVDNVSFWLNDIDTATWDDQLEILVYDTAGNLLPPSTVTFSNIGANVTATTTGPTAIINSNGANLLQTDAAGSVQVTIDDPIVAIGRVEIVYSNLDVGDQFVLVSDLSMTTMPPPPCFVSGTRILTENGDVAIEDLVAGDLVVTAGNGLVPLRWVGKRTVSATGTFAPICIAKGALGNSRDLMVSPAHRMVVSDARVSALFSEDEVLVPAKSLIDGDRIYSKPGGMVTYFHLLFDAHEVIFAEGAPSESLFLGQSSLSAFSKDTLAEVLALFPELDGALPAAGAVARPVLNTAEARLLLN